MSLEKFDVIISGSGVVGGSLACALLQQGLSVALIEQQDKTIAPVMKNNKTDARVFAINPASEKFFTDIGLWNKIVAQRVSAYQHMSVWEQGQGIQFHAADIKRAHLGHIIEQQVLLYAIQQSLDEALNLRRFQPTQIVEFTTTDTAVVVELNNGKSIQGQILIGADGAESSLRQLAGIACDSRHYGHHALVSTVRTEKSHQHTAWQRFLETGPLAFLPLADPHECSIVWSLQPKTARSIITMSDQDFQHALAQAFGQRLGQMTACSPRYLFPLQRRQAETLVQPRLALVGDAIRTVHPLAGQGVNLGLQDVQVLSELLTQAFRQRRNLGSLRLLNRYARQRQLESEIMLQGMDGLKNLFGTSLPLLQPLRNLGLRMTHRQPLLKQFLMREAMGL